MRQETDPETHDLSTEGRYRPGGGSQIWYRTTCSCGRYRSGLRWSPGAAQKDAMQHVRSKTETDNR